MSDNSEQALRAARHVRPWGTPQPAMARALWVTDPSADRRIFPPALDSRSATWPTFCRDAIRLMHKLTTAGCMGLFSNPLASVILNPHIEP
jgi:hypothetical protein